MTARQPPHGQARRLHPVRPAELEPASEYGVAEFQARRAKPRAQKSSARYRPTDEGLFAVRIDKQTGNEILTQLTNAPIEVIEEIISGDDDAEATRRYHVRARIDGRTLTAEVNGSDFNRPSVWVPAALGGGATVLCSDREAVAAIVELSRPIAQRREYGRAGWHRVDGEDLWLGANGCIGPDGPREAPHAVLAEPLGRIEVGAPCKANDCTILLGEVLSMAQTSITAPLLLAVFRAALSDADLIMWLVGVTGARKTAVAAVLQAFAGCRFDARHLPGSWRQDTDKNLLAKAYKSKDCAIVIDEFTVIGSDDRELNEKAEMVGRSIANGAARGRARKDGELAPTRPPGALLIGVGESLPGGAPSMRARMLVLRIDAGDVDLGKLTNLQTAAANGDLAGVMAAFLTWLARDLVGRQAALAEGVRRLRPRFGALGHPRTADVLAALAATAEAVDVWLADGGVPADARAELAERFEAGLRAVGEAQAMAAEAVDLRFVALLRAALASGHGHLTDRRGGPPEVVGHAGWVLSVADSADGPRETRLARGKCLGEVDGGIVYLRLELALSVANAAAGASATRLTADATTLGKALDRGGHLARTDAKRRMIAIRRKGEPMWALRLASLFPADDGDSE